MAAALKAILVATLIGAMLIASVYLAYILIFVVVISIVGGIAYLGFNWSDIMEARDDLPEQ